MKKLITLLLTVSMLIGIVLSAIPSSAATAVNIEYYDVPYFAAEPTVDGFISEAEWGASTFDVDAYDVATKDDTMPYSRFLYWRTGNIDDFRAMSYTVWLRWNENYFWFGAKVNDPDGHSNKNGTTNTWNGDAIQMRIDKDGANAVCSGGEFEVTSEHPRPWGNPQLVPDFLFAYVEIAGGFSEAWENTNNRGMTSFSRNPLGVAKCVVAPAGSSYSSDTAAGITTYEIAIPWTYIFNGDANLTKLEYANYTIGRHGNVKGGIGREFGMSMAVLDNGYNADSTWDAYLAWGSGICEAQQTEGAKAASGSNSVTLSGDKVTPSGYTKYDPTPLLDAKFSTANIDKPNMFYDYLAGDTEKKTPVKYEDLTTVTYDDPGDLSYWGSAISFKGHIGDADKAHGKVLDYRNFYGTDTSDAHTDFQHYLDTRDGEMDFQYPTSYTIEFDICYNDTVIPAINSGYPSWLTNWFGGSSVVDFQCGYFFNDRMFKLVNRNDQEQVFATYNYDLKKDNWYNWKFQFDNESCNARLWIDDLSTTADNADSPWGKLVINTCWRYFYYSSDDALTNGTLLCWSMMNTQCMYDNVKIYNFASVGEVEVPHENTNPGNNNNYGPVEKTETNNIDIGGATKDANGLWTLPVTVRNEYLTATSLVYNLKLNKATFKGIDGLEADEYTVEDLGNGEYKITINDFSALSALKAGDVYFKLLVQAEDPALEAKDVFVSFTDSYKYTSYGSNTSDGLGYIILATVVATLGCAVVIVRRRKAYEE